MGDLVAVRMTTTTRAVSLPTVVQLSATDQPFVGSVLCDDPYVIGTDEIDAAAGAPPPSTMHRINAALRLALGL